MKIQLAATIPGFQPLPPENAMLIGARDLDPQEAELLKQTSVAIPVLIGMGGRLKPASAFWPDWPQLRKHQAECSKQTPCLADGRFLPVYYRPD
jgi:hypothetical protein